MSRERIAFLVPTSYPFSTTTWSIRPLPREVPVSSGPGCYNSSRCASTFSALEQAVNMAVKFQKILLPTDFSTLSAVATKYACELAVKLDSELHLLHGLESQVDPTTPAFEMGLVGIALPTYIRESKAAAENSLTRVLDPQWAASRRVVYAVVEGSPKAEIVRYARQQDIDLIVLATHGRTGLSHVFMGSVAENVVRTASCPVLTLRPERHGFVMP